MKRQGITIGALLTCILLFCVAGTKLSRLTRTRTIQTNSVFLVSTQDSSGRFYSRGIWGSDLSDALLSVSTNTPFLGMFASELWVDNTGSDNTGMRGRMDKPFATPAAAKAAAQEGDLIIVNPGTYTGAGVSNLFKPGKLTWQFNDAVLDYIDLCTNVTTGSGIFDDRFAGGAVSNTILGSIKIRYCSGTNVVFDGACTPYTIATNALGPIVLTNAQTEVLWFASTDIRHWGMTPQPFALYVKNCRPGTIFRSFDYVTNGAPFSTLTFSNCPLDPGDPIQADVGCNFVYWELGSFQLWFGRASGFSSYAFDFYGVTNTDIANVHMHGNFLDGKLYAVGYSSQWKVWLDILEWQNSTASGSLINCYNSGSHYFHIQKASTALGPILDFTLNGVTSDTNLYAWVDIEKASSSNSWANIKHGIVAGRIGHFQQNGPNNGTDLINVSNISAGLILSGETMEGVNTLVVHGGGRTELHGYRIISTNRDPIKLHGAGLSLDVPSIETINGTNSIRSIGAQTVNVWGAYAGPAPDANTTLGATNRIGLLVASEADLLTAIATNLAAINVGISNSITTNALAINAGISNLIGTNLLGINAALSNATTTNLLAIQARLSNGIATNFLAINANLSNAITTNALAINSGLSNAIITNLLVINAGLSNAITTNALTINAGISNAVVTNTLIINAGISNLVGTNALSISGSISNLFATNAAVRMGRGSSNAIVGGRTLNDLTLYTNHSSASLNFTNLGATTLAAHSLTNQGDSVSYVWDGFFRNATAATNQLMVRYGSNTNVFNSGFQFASNTFYEVTTTITKLNAAGTLQLVSSSLTWQTNGNVLSQMASIIMTAETNGVDTTVSLQHMGPGAFGVTNYAIVANWSPAR